MSREVPRGPSGAGAAPAVPLELRTSRLELRRLGPEHVEDLVALDADPEVMRFIPTNAPNTRERYEAELLPRMLAWDDRPFGFLAAFEAGRFVGWLHLRPSVADPAVLELGYRLRREAWGRGLATEGARALLRHAFETLGEPAVDACTLEENVGSIRVLERCGMRRVGTFVHPRIPIEVVRFLVTAEQAVLDGDPLGPAPRRGHLAR